MEMQYFIVGAILIGLALFIFYSRIYLLQVELKDQGDRIRTLTTNNHILATGVKSMIEQNITSPATSLKTPPVLKADLTDIKPTPRTADETDDDDDDVDDIVLRTILNQTNRGHFSSIVGVEDADVDDRATVELIDDIKSDAIPEHIEGVKKLPPGTPADVEESNAAEAEVAPTPMTRVNPGSVGGGATCTAMIIDGKKAGQLCKKKTLKNKVFCREHNDLLPTTVPVSHSIELNFSDGSKTDPILLDGGVGVQNPVVSASTFNSTTGVGMVNSDSI